MSSNKASSAVTQGRFTRILFAAVFGLVIAFGIGSTQAYAADDVVIGTIDKIDAGAKKIYIKTKDGTIRVFKWSKKTTTHGIDSARVWTDHTLHTGANVVARIEKEGTDDVVKGLHWVGAGTVQVEESVVRHFGKGTGRLEVASVGKTKEIFDISEHAVVKTGSKVLHKTNDIENNLGKGVNAVVHYVERDGKKVVHYVEHKIEK